MGISWKAVAEKIATISPILGTILGGPIGSIVATTGSLIAQKLNVEPAPEAIFGMLNDPANLIKLKELENEYKQKLIEYETMQIQAEVERLKIVNSTMQAEAYSEKWPQYSWRPFWGFTSALAFIGFVYFILFLAYKAIHQGETSALNMIPTIITSMTGLFAIPGAILGITAWHRGKEKRERRLYEAH